MTTFDILTEPQTKAAGLLRTMGYRWNQERYCKGELRLYQQVELNLPPRRQHGRLEARILRKLIAVIDPKGRTRHPE